MSAGNRAEALIEAMEQLIEIYQEENRAIQIRDLSALHRVAERKPLLVRTYEDCVRSVKQEPESLQALDDTGRLRLKQKSDGFIDATLEHARLVRAATHVTQSMVNTLVGAINKARADDGLYTRRGGTVLPAAYARKTAPSMSINRQL